MGAKYWLKLYYDMLDDSKIGKLRPAIRWRFIECLLVAGECEDEGYLPDIVEYAWRVRSDIETVETDFVTLAESGLLSQNNGRWLVTNFSKRQAAVDATERWRRWRDRQRQQEYQQEQTNFQRNQTKAQTNRLIDIDKDIDIDIDKNGANAPNHTHTIGGFAPEVTETEYGNEKRDEMITTIASVVKDTYAIGLNADKFEQVANALIAANITEEQVIDFGAWWSEPGNGYYEGKPALKTLLQEIKNTAGPKPKHREWWEKALNV